MKPPFGDAERHGVYPAAGRALFGATSKDDHSYVSPDVRGDPDVRGRTRNEVVPSVHRSAAGSGTSWFADHPGREIDASAVVVAPGGNNGQVENPSTLVTTPTEEVQIAQYLRESHNELRRLVINVQECERRRIAMDLHDGIGQSLILIKLSLENALILLAAGATGEAGQSLQQLVPRVREAVGEVRRVSTELRPWILDSLGIVRTLSWFFRELEAARCDITVEQAIAVAEHEVPVPLQVTIFRILQEATSNIVKHSGCNLVRVTLERADDVLTLLIEDNGCGFSADSVQLVEGRRRGFGLLSMEERTSLSGGSYRLESVPGKGTRIRISWPCGKLPA